MKPDELVNPDLDADDRALLSFGLNEWLGPARCTEELAVGMGFDGLDGLYTSVVQLRSAIDGEEPLTRVDWCRALLATEIVFVSNLVGSGHDWMFTTGLSDLDTIVRLRGLQVKLIDVTAGLVGHGFGTVPG